MLIVRNPYWSANARILGRDTAGLDNVDRITITIGVPPDQQLQQIARGEADLSLDQAASAAPQLARIQRSAGLRRLLVVAPGLGLRYFWFNTTIPPFDNALLRRAVNYAIDRRDLAAVLGTASLIAPTSQLIPSTLLAPGTALDVYPQTADLAMAIRLVRESGAKTPIPLSYWYPTGFDSGDDAVAQSLKARLDAAGFRVTLHPVDANFYWTDIADPRNHISMGSHGWLADIPDAVDFFEPLLNGSATALADPNAVNLGRFAVPAVDRRIAQIAAMPLGDARTHGWTQLSEEIARTDAPWASFGEIEDAAIASPRVRNLVLNGVRGGVDYALVSLP